MRDSGDRIIRFNVFERVVHWIVALSFIVTALTGMGLYMPGLFWLTGIFGGGAASRWLHPWAGVVFAASLVVMALMWARHMVLDSQDMAWLRRVGAYIAHRPGVPEAGRFNAGQKLLFWLVILLGAVEFVTGLFMWSPDLYGGTTALRISYPVHSLAAAGYIALFILHVYMGTIALPGTFETMTHGRITRTWARVHHPRWYRQVVAREQADAAVPSAGVDVGAAARPRR